MLSRLRNLIFDTITANIDGLAAIIARIPDFGAGARDGAGRRALKSGFATALQYWPLLIGGFGLFSILFVTLVGWWALSR